MSTSNRRTFLKTTAVLAAGMSLGRVLPAQTVSGGSKSQGLLFDRNDLPRIRANLENPRFSKIRAAIFGINLEAETRFLSEELRLNNHVADFLRAWQVLQNASFGYALDGDPKKLALSRLAIRRLLEYKRWDYFLEGGAQTIGLQRAPESTIAACYAIDWLGDGLPADERAALEKKIGDEGAPACYRTLYGMKYPDRVRGWGFDPEDDYQFRFDLSRWPIILNATNLKVIPICGLGMAAISLYGKHPEAEKWLDMARQSARAFASMYGSDGSYDEGVGYWGYTTMHLAMFADALYRRLGIDDRQLINYPGTIRYAQAMSMPCGGDVLKDSKLAAAYNAVPKGDYDPRYDLVNFSDSGVGADVSIACWVGPTANDPFSQYVANHTGLIGMLQAAVWYRPELKEEPPPNSMLDVRMVNDWVISRTGWGADDTVVALRSGGPANHEHADRNSVIFKAHGERLFHDPFKAGYSHTLPRWLLRQTEAHTAVLIDGKGHQYHDGREGTNASWAFAHVTGYKTGGGWMMVTSNATEAYALVTPETKSVTRTLLFLKPEVLILLDHVKLTKPMPVQMRFQVFNDDGKGHVLAGGTDTFSIDRPLAGLRARVQSSHAFSLRTGKLSLPSSEGIFPYAEVVSEPAQEHMVVTACTVAPAGSSHGSLLVRQTGDRRWIISGKHRGHDIHGELGMDDDGNISTKFQTVSTT